MNVATRGIRNAFRNLTRTLSIVIILGLSIGLSLVMLIAHQAVQAKITTTLSSVGNTVSIEPAGYTPSSTVNNALTTSELQKVASLTHVTKLDELLSDNLQTDGTSSLAPTPGGGGASTSLKSPTTLNCANNGSGNSCTGVGAGSGQSVGASGAMKLPSNFSLPVPIIGTNEPTSPTALDSSPLKIISGKAIDGNTDNSEAMVSTAMASKNNLKIGSTFTAYGKTLTVPAIFKSDVTTGSDTVIVSLPTEQSLSGQSGDVSSATATVDSLSNLSSTTAAIKEKLGSSADVTSSIAQADKVLAPLNSIKSISMYSLVGAVVAGAVITLLTMVMIVRERKHEIGVLKAIGFSNVRIMFQFIGEAFTLTLLGAGIGLLIGISASNWVTKTLVNNSFNSGNRVGNIADIHTQIGYTVILAGIGSAALIAIAGSALASFFISKVRPAEVLRSE